MLPAGGSAQQPVMEADADAAGSDEHEEKEQELPGIPREPSDPWEPGGSWWQAHQQGHVGRGGPDGKHPLTTVAIDDDRDQQCGQHAGNKKDQQRSQFQ